MAIINFDEVVQQLKPYLIEYLQEHGIAEPAKIFKCINPAHEDSTPSAQVVGVSEGSPRIYCFGCQATYDIFDACYIFEKKPRAGKGWAYETLKYLADKYHVNLELGELSEEEVYELDTWRAYRAASELLVKKEMPLTPGLEKAWKEVQRRGWNEETLEKFTIGSVVDYVKFIATLKTQGFSSTFLKEIDVARRDIFNADNLIFTWKDEHGRPCGFTGRNLKYEEEVEEQKKNGTSTRLRKYNNQQVTGVKCNIFRKNSRLYGIDTALTTSPPVYIFEGQADAITAKHHGLLNCCAFAGGLLSDDHVELLKRLEAFDLVIATDGDKAGEEKTEAILEKRLAGHRELSVRVIILPEKEDPDSFIRNHGIKAFRSLAKWTAFEWRLNRFPEEVDPSDICKQMVPFIVNESSPIKREELCKILAKRTGVSFQAISEELLILLDSQAHAESLEREEILRKIGKQLQSNPRDAEYILQEAKEALSEISKKHDISAFSEQDCVEATLQQKEKEERKSAEYGGFQLGPDLRPLQDALAGEWSKDVFMLFAARENVGKTAILCKIGFSVALYNPDVTVIVHSIDDTREQLIPRFICLADGSRQLTFNQVMNPNYWQELHWDGKDLLQARREAGYARILELMRSGRLIIKDVNNGSSLSYIENLVKFHQAKQNKTPRKILYILDNFHKLKDFGGFKDERVRWKALSQATKEMAERLHIPILSSVEYTKTPLGQKPNNQNISETVQVLYDANFIVHIYNEIAEVPESFTVCHKHQDWRGEQVFLPRNEMIVGKNKISGNKDTFFLDFWPESSDFRWVDRKTVARDQAAMGGRGKKRGDDPFGGAFEQ